MKLQIMATLNRYRYRWIILLNLILIILLLPKSLVPLRLQLLELRHIQAHYKNQNTIPSIRKISKPRKIIQNDIPLKEAVIMQELLLLAHKSQLIVNDIINNPSQLEITLQGKYADLMGYLHQVTAMSSLILLKDFSLQIIAIDTLQLKMKLMLMPRYQINPSYLSKNKENNLNPFCQSLYDYPTQQNSIAINKFSLMDMQVTGVIHDNQRGMALLTMPDNQTAIITKGNRLGREQAIVKRITNEKVIFILPNSHEYQLCFIKQKC